MMRILLIMLAVVIAVLAVLMNQVWLYWVAGALAVAAVVAVGMRMWRRYQEALRFQREENAPLTRHADLSELGIMEVRPKDDQPADRAAADRAAADREAERPAAPSASDASDASDAPAEPSAEAPASPEDIDVTPTEHAADAPAEAPAAAPVQTAERPAETDPVYQPIVEALRSAVDAHAACLLVQEDVMLSYQIAAASGRSTPVRPTGTFETADPLLSARMTQVAVTVEAVGRGGINPAHLGYYEQPPALEQVALAPVPTPSSASTFFLVVDATDTDLDHPRVKKIIAHFADLLGVLIESSASTPIPTDPVTPDEDAPPPRPRREIIAEEIQEARRADVPLALALVHLNRAEQLAEQGPPVVADAESALRRRLERSAPRSRVERFGELTFGVFYNGGVTDVEPWAERLQEEMNGIGGLLSGGVSIGVALLREDGQSPEALREEATEALRMAYETGTCTIVE